MVRTEKQEDRIKPGTCQGLFGVVSCRCSLGSQSHDDEWYFQPEKSLALPKAVVCLTVAAAVEAINVCNCDRDNN